MLFLRYYLWIAPYILLGLFFFLFLRRKLYLQLPSFAIYVAIQLLGFLGTLICSLHRPFSYRVYGWILMLGDSLSGIVAVWVLYELVSKLIVPRPTLVKLGQRLFAVALVILVLSSAAISGRLSDHSIYRALNFFEDINFSSAFIKVGLLLVLLVFSRALNVSWSNWFVGIALGFGVDACFDLSTAAWRAAYGRAALISVDIVQGVGFHICVVIWLVYLLLPEGPSRSTGPKLHKEDLEAWSDQLQNIVR
jgi:hypothetical protein